jgi:hypothetical protein
MFSQFIIENKAKLEDYGIDERTGTRYFTYVDEANNYRMTAYTKCKEAFDVKQLHNLVNANLVELTDIKFSQIMTYSIGDVYGFNCVNKMCTSVTRK